MLESNSCRSEFHINIKSYLYLLIKIGNVLSAIFDL